MGFRSYQEETGLPQKVASGATLLVLMKMTINPVKLPNDHLNHKFQQRVRASLMSMAFCFYYL